MRGATLMAIAFALAGCTSQFSLGPAAWATAAPVIPGFTAVPLGGGGFVEEPNSLLGGAGAAPAEPIAHRDGDHGLEQAQKVRTLTRQLSR